MIVTPEEQCGSSLIKTSIPGNENRLNRAAGENLASLFIAIVLEALINGRPLSETVSLPMSMKAVRVEGCLPPATAPVRGPPPVAPPK